ncbi:MAG: GAF domain-containing protein [Clostridia bacterium]|nr:GAF domain-containing protein [Clostridia bacterium]
MESNTSLLAELSALTQGVPHRIANLANASALLFDRLPDLNWAGFYLLEGDRLILGPFQGKPACIEIPMGRGVCGSAAVQGKTLCVPNVHDFPGHIACDAASASEVVIPMYVNGSLFGVLDIDSPILNRFSPTDVEILEECVRVLECALSE